MLALILNLYRIKFIKPGVTFQLIISLLKVYYQISRKKNGIDFNRFIRANKLPNSIRFEQSMEKLSIELIIVSSRKDFDVISKTLKVTLSKLSNFNSINISIIVPRADLELAKDISLKFNHKVSIVDEYQILDSDFLNSLKSIFSSRATWVYQQALKLNALSRSEENYAMILDADTVILNSRTWLFSDKKLVLTPSDEYNMEYYNFLKCISVGELHPEFTFVSHHMFYDVKLVKKMLEELSLTLPAKQLSVIKQYSNKSAPSPLCIDYELYGQWISSYKFEQVVLLKWSNIGISKQHLDFFANSRIIRWMFSKLYNSVSFHSWS
jgi:hypothetical protein